MEMLSKSVIFHRLESDTKTTHTRIRTMSTYVIKKVIDDVHGHYIAWEKRIEKGNQKSVRDGQKRKKKNRDEK